MIKHLIPSMRKLILLPTFLFSMQPDPPKLFMALLPVEIAAEAFKFYIDECKVFSCIKCATHLEKFYASLGSYKNNVTLSKEIFSYHMKKNRLHSTDLSFLEAQLWEKLPIFENKEFKKWLYDERKRLYLEENLRMECNIGNIGEVKFLLSQNVDCNSQNKSGINALTALLHSNHSNQLKYEIAQLLVEKGVEVNVYDEIGFTPLMRSIGIAHLPLVKLLLQANADANMSNRGVDTPPLFYSIDQDFNIQITTEITEALLQKGANINFIGNYNFTLLSKLLVRMSFNERNSKKHIELLKILLKAGADTNLGKINMSPRKQISFLTYAKKRLKNQEVIDLLTRYGAHE
jgi:hypothetical protein